MQYTTQPNNFYMTLKTSFLSPILLWYYLMHTYAYVQFTNELVYT